MKVSKLVEALLKLPQDHDIEFIRQSHYGDIELDFSHLEVKRDVRILPRDTSTDMAGQFFEEPDHATVELSGGVEETTEKCIMVFES